MHEISWKCGSTGRQRLVLAQGTPLTIGRDQDCDITISDDRISRAHARIRLNGNTIEVEDLDSSNGTFIAGERITKTQWRQGQTLKVGDCHFEVKDSGNQDISTLPTKVLSKGRPSIARTKDGRSINFIQRHWRGEYSLGRSVFINSLLVSTALVFAIANLTELVAADASPRARLIYVTIVFLTALVISVWQIVGNWRSVRGAKARGAWHISRILAGVFTGILILGIPFSFYEYTQSWSALRALETGRDSGGRSAYALTADGNVLMFEGAVTWPLVGDFETQLRANPQIDTVILKSSGGDTTAGRRINDQLRERGVVTFVREGCASACTLIYAAGRNRAITPDGRLGFHATSVILMDPMMTRIMNSFTFRHDSLNADVFRRAGFSEPFIQRAVSTPSTDLWVPSIEQLQQAGVITDIVR